jgi:Protein of unknown function (DUF2442)
MSTSKRLKAKPSSGSIPRSNSRTASVSRARRSPASKGSSGNMRPQFARHGELTSGPEVVNLSAHGFWLNIAGEELFLSFSAFPWFRNATVAQIADVTNPSADHLYWQELDIDLSIQSIRNPTAFPLVSR